MSTCEYIRFNKPKICIGDLNKRIELLKKALVPSQSENVYGTDNYDYDYQLDATVWAAIKNIKGDVILDSVSPDDLPTHWFYIRYLVNIDNDYRIRFRNEEYKILDVTNLLEDNVYLQIKTVKTGNISKVASQV